MNVPPDFTSSALTTLAALAIVLLGLGLLYVAARRFLQRGIAGPANQPIRVLSSHFVGVKKSIALVQVPGAVLVVGITSERMNLLDKIEDPVLLDQLRSGEEDEPSGFSAQLNKLTERFKAMNKSR